MKLKFYLRGLGIGIVVTAIIMSLAFSKKEEVMTDEQIKARALELGMTDDSGVLSDLSKETESDNVVEAVSENVISENTVSTNGVSANETEQSDKASENIISKNEVKKNEPVTEDPVIEEPIIDETLTNQNNENVNSLDETTESKIVTITIQSGDGSNTVAKRLEQAGLVKNAVVYDAYLCKNGYDKKLCVGAHEIPMGSSDEEIAKLLCKK